MRTSQLDLVSSCYSHSSYLDTIILIIIEVQYVYFLNTKQTGLV